MWPHAITVQYSTMFPHIGNDAQLLHPVLLCQQHAFQFFGDFPLPWLKDSVSLHDFVQVLAHALNTSDPVNHLRRGLRIVQNDSAYQRFPPLWEETAGEHEVDPVRRCVASTNKTFRLYCTEVLCRKDDCNSAQSRRSNDRDSTTTCSPATIPRHSSKALYCRHTALTHTVHVSCLPSNKITNSCFYDTIVGIYIPQHTRSQLLVSLLEATVRNIPQPAINTVVVRRHPSRWKSLDF